MKLLNQNIYNLRGCKNLWGRCQMPLGGVQIIYGGVPTPQKIRACTYGRIREVRKTHAVQENRGRAKTVPLKAPSSIITNKRMSVSHQTPINNFAASAKHFVSMFFNPLSQFECQHSPPDE
jgi:hypothetical protein